MFENYRRATADILESWCAWGNQAMIGFSLRGKAHQSRGIPMQDCHAIRTLSNGWELAVVCDGVGSKSHSDEGAKIAANTFANFVTDFWGGYQDAESVLNLLKCAALHATGEIRNAAEKCGRSVHEYSTTLHAAVYANGLVYWFHSGDGGIIALTDNGTLKALTEPQKEGEYVVPLLEGPTRWAFGQSDTRVQSIMLCTDGIYEKIAGSVLRKHGNGIDRGIASFFMSPWAFSDWKDLAEITEQLRTPFSDSAQDYDFYPAIARAVAQGSGELRTAELFVREHVYAEDRPLRSLKSIQDDITVVIIQDLVRKPLQQPMDYYRGPDWTAINQSIYSILYGNNKGWK